LITTVAPAVAKAAMETGVARVPITDWDEYIRQLRKRLGLDNKLIMGIHSKAQQDPKRVVFAEANNFKILKAAETVIREKIAYPILIGDKTIINEIIDENQLHIPDPEIIELFDPSIAPKRQEFARILFSKRQRKGMTMEDAEDLMLNRDYFGSMMVETGEADALISGFSRKYSDTIRPALHVIGVRKEFNRIAGMYIMITKKGPLFLADTTVNIQPSAQALVEITLLTATEVRKFNIEPVIEAVTILHRDYPELILDGEIQADYIFNPELRKKKFPFTLLQEKDVNTIIFPDLCSGNILYKSLQGIGAAEAIGPVLMGMNKPVHILQMESSVREIVNMAAIAVVDAQVAGKK
jgi:malate dehydrogenase (oxaloacetate-decarboxylating)(NADP+)